MVAAAFAAEEEGDVSRLVGLVHPEAMSAFKQRQLADDAMFAELRSDTATFSASTGPQDEPNSSAASGQEKTMLQAVFKVRDSAEFGRLAPVQVLTRWFRHTTRHHAPPAGVPSELPKRSRDIIGEVADHDDLVHVVFREVWTATSYPGFLGRRDPQIRVITTQRTADGWRVMLNGGLVYDESGGWGIGWGNENEEPR